MTARRGERPTARGTKQRTSAQAIVRAELAAECLRLRRSGHTFSEIAEMVGMECKNPEHRVRTIVEAELRALKRPVADDLINEELDILDRVINRGLRLMSGSDRDRVQAGNMVLSAQKRRAELLGLDAPKKVDLKDERQHDIPTSTVAAVVAQLAAELGEDEAGAGSPAADPAAGA